MREVVVVVEGASDFPVVRDLTERVLIEQIEWLDAELLPHQFQWNGITAQSDWSEWRSVKSEMDRVAERHKIYQPRFRRRANFKTDGAIAFKLLRFIHQLPATREIVAVILYRDLDNQSERHEGLNQARQEHQRWEEAHPVVIGTADRMREAWILNGFMPENAIEEAKLDDQKAVLKFDPCLEPHRLRENSFGTPERVRNPKVVVATLTGADREREARCWQETDLRILRERGEASGLRHFLDEVQEYLAPIFG